MWDKLQPDGPLGLYSDFTLPSGTFYCKTIKHNYSKLQTVLQA